MKRSPFKIAMVVLAYLAAGAVMNLVVAAACALWMPMSDGFLEYESLPEFAVRWTPVEWVERQLAIGSQPPKSWTTINAKQRAGVGMSLVQVRCKATSMSGIPNPFDAKQRLILRSGLPLRCLESATDTEPEAFRFMGASRAMSSFKPAVLLPWQVSPIDNTPAGKYEAMDLSYVTRNFIPLSPVWSGLMANTIVWGLILALFVHVPCRLRAVLRLRRGVCPRCAYPIGTSPNCTECGHALPRMPVQPGTP